MLTLEQLALTEQLLDAALGELGSVAGGQPCKLVGDFNEEPCLAKAGLWVDLEASWASASGGLPALACKRAWNSSGGSSEGFSWWVAFLLLLFFLVEFRLAGGLPPHLAVQTLSDCGGWLCRDTQRAQRTPLWPAAWLPAVDGSRLSESVEVQRIWEVYGERLQFMLRHDAIQLDESSGCW